MFDDFFARKAISKLIAKAVETLYSGTSNLDALVKEMSGNEEDISLIRSYIAIQTAAQLTEPLKSSDVDAAFASFRAAQKHLDQPEFSEILDIHRELAELLWNDKQQAFLRGGSGGTMDESEEARQLDAVISSLNRRLDSLLEGV
jgi:hypothetical protein